MKIRSKDAMLIIAGLLAGGALILSFSMARDWSIVVLLLLGVLSVGGILLGFKGFRR